PHDAVDGGHELRIVEPIFGLSLKLRLLNEDAENAGRAFPDVLGGDRDAFWREVVGLDEVADGFAEPRAQSILVRAARPGRNAIDVRADVLVRGLGPLKHEIEPQTVIFTQHEWRVVHRFRAALRDDFLKISDDALVVLERRPLLRRLVLENNLHAL